MPYQYPPTHEHEERTVSYKEWPGVDEAVAALTEQFGNAEVIHTGGPCYSIQVVLEGIGLLWVGDINGPLGESNTGWAAVLNNVNWEYIGPVCEVPDRSVSKLVAGIRAFLRNATGLD